MEPMTETSPNGSYAIEHGYDCITCGVYVHLRGYRFDGREGYCVECYDLMTKGKQRVFITKFEGLSGDIVWRDINSAMNEIELHLTEGEYHGPDDRLQVFVHKSVMTMKELDELPEFPGY